MSNRYFGRPNFYQERLVGFLMKNPNKNEINFIDHWIEKIVAEIGLHDKTTEELKSEVRKELLNSNYKDIDKEYDSIFDYRLKQREDRMKYHLNELNGDLRFLGTMRRRIAPVSEDEVDHSEYRPFISLKLFKVFKSYFNLVVFDEGLKAEVSYLYQRLKKENLITTTKAPDFIDFLHNEKLINDEQRDLFGGELYTLGNSKFNNRPERFDAFFKDFITK